MHQRTLSVGRVRNCRQPNNPHHRHPFFRPPQRNLHYKYCPLPRPAFVLLLRRKVLTALRPHYANRLQRRRRCSRYLRYLKQNKKK